MAGRLGTARLEALLENLDRALNLEGSDLTVNTLTSDGAIVATTGGVTVTAGGLLVTAGRIREAKEKADLDAQDGVLTVERISKGVLLHTTATGASTLTSDSATNIVAGHSGVGALTANHQCIECVVVNDGNQNLDFAAGSGVTFLNGGASPVVAANGACRIIFQRTSATAVNMIVLAE